VHCTVLCIYTPPHPICSVPIPYALVRCDNLPQMAIAAGKKAHTEEWLSENQDHIKSINTIGTPPPPSHLPCSPFEMHVPAHKERAKSCQPRGF
jgi:hypothetical protein